MARLMSVAFTEDAVRERRKTVTRRKGWWEDRAGRRILTPGTRLTLCRKVMGRKKGEPLVRIVDVEVVSVRREPLCDLISFVDYGLEEVVREGFPDLEPAQFVRRYFIDAQGVGLDQEVTRIEWRYIEPEPVYGKCTACGSVEVALNKANGTTDLSAIGESDTYPTGYGCEVCS